MAVVFQEFKTSLKTNRQTSRTQSGLPHTSQEELGISCQLYAHINIFLPAGHAPCQSLHRTDTIEKAKEGKIRKLSFYYRGQKVKGAQAGPTYATLRFSFTKFPLQTHAARGQQDGSWVQELAARPNLRIPTLEPMWWKGRTLNPHTRWNMSAPRQIQKNVIELPKKVTKSITKCLTLTILCRPPS